MTTNYLTNYILYRNCRSVLLRTGPQHYGIVQLRSSNVLFFETVSIYFIKCRYCRRIDRVNIYVPIFSLSGRPLQYGRLNKPFLHVPHKHMRLCHNLCQKKFFVIICHWQWYIFPIRLEKSKPKVYLICYVCEIQTKCVLWI